MTGNHLADQSDKARDDASKCPDCKAELVDIDWCERDGVECSTSLGCSVDCADGENMDNRIKCPRCGTVYPIKA